jgi:glycosyltransferase involved in cell wall biosynthesis
LTEQISASAVNKFAEDARVVVGIPCFNEEKAIAKVVLQLKGLADEIIVCDDGSQDMTTDIALALGCKVITHERNMGKGAALRSLFLAAREELADVFVTIDGDGQHDVEDIPTLIEAIRRGACDVAIGSRFEKRKHSEEMPQYRRLGSKILNSLVKKTTKIKANDTQSGLRAYSRSAMFSITPGEHGIAVDTEILALAANQGMRVKEFPATIRYKGLETSSQNPVSQSLEVVSGAIKYVSIRHPLKFYGIPALFFFFFSMGLAIWTAVVFDGMGHLPFGPTVATISAFMLSIVLGAVAIILFTLTTVVRESR